MFLHIGTQALPSDPFDHLSRPVDSWSVIPFGARIVVLVIEAGQFLYRAGDNRKYTYLKRINLIHRKI